MQNVCRHGGYRDRDSPLTLGELVASCGSPWMYMHCTIYYIEVAVSFSLAIRGESVSRATVARTPSWRCEMNLCGEKKSTAASEQIVKPSMHSHCDPVVKRERAKVDELFGAPSLRSGYNGAHIP